MTMNKKLKKTLQCTMCAVLSLGMVVCNSSFVEAKKIKKQESVYVNAAADGSVSKITVSDWLKGANETTGTINAVARCMDGRMLFRRLLWILCVMMRWKRR